MDFKKTVIIVAGGSGSRMKSDTPKQFILLHNKPILVHTIERFFEFDSQIKIILVLPEEHVHVWEELAQEYRIEHPVDVVEGGNTRYESVQNGMSQALREGVIGVHDGVRPLVSNETLTRVFLTAFEKGNAIPAIPVDETIRLVDGENNKWVNREAYRIIQTPQCFKADLIKDAYEQEYQISFTDDASVFESKGHSINLVSGNKENIKITRPEDLTLAEYLLES
jgi:2-C-methyl-D-erythritol 4-phosphate cytidylyltransferase